MAGGRSTGLVGEAGQAPAVGEAPDELADRVRVAVTRLHRRLRHQSLAGLSASQVSLLGAVGRLEAPTLGELAAAEGVQPPTVTRLVAGLEQAGLLTRRTDPEDRRVMRVRLSEDGRHALLEIRSLKTTFLSRRLGSLSAAERGALADALAVLERLANEA